MTKFIQGETWEDYEIRSNKEREHMCNSYNVNDNDNVGPQHSVHHQNAQMQDVGSTQYMYGDSLAPHNAFDATSAYQFPDGDPFVPRRIVSKANEGFPTYTPGTDNDSMASRNGFNAVGQYQFRDGEPFVAQEGSSRELGGLSGPTLPTHRQVLAGCKRKRLETLPRVSNHDQPMGGNNRFKINDHMSFNEGSWQVQTVNKPNCSSQPQDSAQCAQKSQVSDADVIEISDDEQPVSRTKRQRTDENPVGPFHAREYQPINSPVRGPKSQIHRNIPQNFVSSGRSDLQQTGSTIKRRRRQVAPADPNRGLAPFGHNTDPNTSSSHGHAQLSQSNSQAANRCVQAGTNVNMHPITLSAPVTRPALVERDTPRRQQIHYSNSDTDSRGSYPYCAQKYQPSLPTDQHMSCAPRAGVSHSDLSSNFPYTPNSVVNNNPHWNSIEKTNNARSSSSKSRPLSRQRLRGPQGPYSSPYQSSSYRNQPAPRPSFRGLQGSHSSPGHSKTPLTNYIESPASNLQGVAMNKRKREDIIEEPGLRAENLRMEAKRQRPLSPFVSHSTSAYTQTTQPSHRPISPRLSRQVSDTTNSRGHISLSVGNTSRNGPQNGRFQGNGVFPDYGECHEHQDSQEKWKLQAQHGLDDLSIVVDDDLEPVWEASTGSTPASRYSGQTCQPHIDTPFQAQATRSVDPISQSNSWSLFNHQPQAKPPSRANLPQANPLSLAGIPHSVNLSTKTNASVDTKRDQQPHVGPSVEYPSVHGNASFDQPGYAHRRDLQGPPTTFSDQALTQNQVPQLFQYPLNQQNSRLGYPYEEVATYQHQESSEGQQYQQHYQMGYGYPEENPYQHQDYVAGTTLASSSNEESQGQGQNQIGTTSFDYTAQDFLPVYDPPITTWSKAEQFNVDVSDSRSPVVTSPVFNIDAVDPPFASPPVVDAPLVLPPVVTPPAATPLVIQPDFSEAEVAEAEVAEAEVAEAEVAEAEVAEAEVAEAEVAEPGVIEPDVSAPNVVDSVVVKPYSVEEPDDFHPSVASPIVDCTSRAETSQVKNSGRAASYGHSIKSTGFVPWCEEDLRYVTPYLESEKAEITKALKFTRRHYFNIVGEDPPPTSRDLSYAKQWGEMQATLASRWLGLAPVPTLFSLKPWDWKFSSWLHPHTERINGRLRYSEQFYTGMDLTEDAFKYYGEPYESEWAKEQQEGLGSRNPIKDPWGLWNHTESYSYSDDNSMEALGAGEGEELPPDDTEFHGFVETESVHSHTGDDDAVADSKEESQPGRGQIESSDVESEDSSGNPGDGATSAVPGPKPITGQARYEELI